MATKGLAATRVAANPRARTLVEGDIMLSVCVRDELRVMRRVGRSALGITSGHRGSFKPEAIQQILIYSIVLTTSKEYPGRASQSADYTVPKGEGMGRI